MVAQESIAPHLPVKMPPDFPLHLHRATRQWRKAIHGRDYYFGEDWRLALVRYDHDRPFLEAGKPPPPLRPSVAKR